MNRRPATPRWRRWHGDGRRWFWREPQDRGVRPHAVVRVGSAVVGGEGVDLAEPRIPPVGGEQGSARPVRRWRGGPVGRGRVRVGVVVGFLWESRGQRRQQEGRGVDYWAVGPHGPHARWQGVHVSLHGLLTSGGHVTEGVLDPGGWEGGKELVAFSPADGSSVPSFGTYLFSVLPLHVVLMSRGEVAVNGVKGRSAESLEHLDDAQVHPGRPARFWIMQLGQHPRRNAT